MGWVVGLVDTYFAGIGWWLIFGVGHMSEVSMQTGGKACGGLGGGTSSQMGLCDSPMERRWVSGAVGVNAWDVLHVQVQI